MLALYAQALLLMGGFVALYNYLGFRLSAAPFSLPQTLISLLFVAYLAGTWSAAQAGVLAARFGRRSVLLIAIGCLVVGVLLTLSTILVVVLLGLLMATAGFFAAHAVASGWTGAEAVVGRAQASSLYNLLLLRRLEPFRLARGRVLCDLGVDRDRRHDRVPCCARRRAGDGAAERSPWRTRGNRRHQAGRRLSRDDPIEPIRPPAPWWTGHPFDMEIAVVEHVAPRRRRLALMRAIVGVLALSGCGATATPPTGAAPAGATGSATTAKPTIARPGAAKPTIAKPGAAKPAAAKPAAAKPSSPAARSTLVTDAASGFSVRLPAGYTQITSKARLNELIKAGAATNPKLKGLVQQYAALGNRARVFAYKLDSSNTFTDNLNIMTIPSTAGADQIGQAFDKVKPELEKVGATITNHRVEEIGGTKALRVEYRLRMPGKRVRGTQFYFIHRGNIVVTTISQIDREASEPDASAIIGSLRLL
jgi:hypothetical protein